MDQLELRKRWVEALRSGKYQQAKGRLRDGDAFCCLGVLCDVYDPSQWDGGEYLGFYGNLPARVQVDAGLRDAAGLFNGGALATLNDFGKSFAKIADIIESNPPGLFVEAPAETAEAPR